jgi:hypothetical protein
MADDASSWVYFISPGNQKLGGKLLLRKGGEKSEVKIEKIMPNEAYGDKIYLSSLILIRHWRFELGEKTT